jgi:hypothetical protein
MGHISGFYMMAIAVVLTCNYSNVKKSLLGKIGIARRLIVEHEQWTVSGGAKGTAGQASSGTSGGN